jgi:hypothetical protein
VFLKHKTDLRTDSTKLSRAQALKPGATQIDIARVWLNEVHAATQQRGLSCTVGADEGNALACRYCEVNPAQYSGVSVVAFRQPAYDQIGWAELI